MCIHEAKQQQIRRKRAFDVEASQDVTHIKLFAAMAILIFINLIPITLTMTAKHIEVIDQKILLSGKLQRPAISIRKWQLVAFTMKNNLQKYVRETQLEGFLEIYTETAALMCMYIHIQPN